MKDKEKQIEEMAKSIEYAINNECKLNNGKSCEDCEFDNKGDWHCQSLMTATHLYGERYRKLPEDSVVLSREQWEDYKKYVDKCNEEYYRGQHEAEVYYKYIQIPKERKETAEKILCEIDKELYEVSKIYLETVLKDTKDYNSMDKYGIMQIAHEIVVKVGKKNGVEIKE